MGEMSGFLFVVLISAFVGGIIGGGCTYTSYEDNLHQVGIERIEYCHNVHSNWYEIVWKEEK